MKIYHFDAVNCAEGLAEENLTTRAYLDAKLSIPPAQGNLPVFPVPRATAYPWDNPSR